MHALDLVRHHYPALENSRLIDLLLFRHCSELRNIKLGIIEQREFDLPAKIAHIGLRHKPTACCHCARNSRSFGNRSMYARTSSTVRSVPPSLVGRGRVSFVRRYADDTARRLDNGGRNAKSVGTKPVIAG
jgi:hypothetical protein